MVKVDASANETLDQLLRRFKRLCEIEGLTKDIKRKAFHESRGAIRRQKIKRVIHRRELEAFYKKLKK